MITCQSCKTINPDNLSFCKSCGKPLQPSYKTCPNGHNFDASYEQCPHCPSNRGQSTVVAPQAAGTATYDKTRVMDSAPAAAQQPAQREKTVIMAPPGQAQSSPEAKAAVRKLTGWLVSFDIEPSGVDFRLYMGRHIIGRSSRCDIVLQVPGVSEEHAILLYRDGKFILQDNLSANGTFVNDELIEDKITLKENDIITIANIKLKIKMA
jgi:hypothetical protein